MKRISLCGIPCLCALSASAFTDSSLHQLDFFLEIFLWRLTCMYTKYGCGNVVECVLLACLCTLSASTSIHPRIHPYINFLSEIFFKFLVFCCYALPPTHLLLMRHPRTCTDKWRPNSYTLSPRSKSLNSLDAPPSLRNYYARDA